MSYTTISIRESLDKIRENQMYLPAIQRKFVWGYEKITKLFDSIMRGFPIGTFLFWDIGSEKMNEYIFYKFLQDYSERDSFNNQPAPRPETRDKIIGVLDGQPPRF
jgi:uncharacterized protein with ParB-like and HNH nuclease domain